MTSIKFIFDDEIRRVLVREDNFTYSKLMNTLFNLFPILTTVGKSFHLYWQDDEGDLIGLQSDAELDEAVRVMRAFGNSTTALKFIVKLDNQEDRSAASAAAASAFPSKGSAVVHTGITCDECGVSPIVGIRYKCTVRHDFDLCESCEAKKPQPHAMIKITDPSQAPELLVYGLREPPVRPHHFHHGHGHHGRQGCAGPWQRGQRLGGEESPHCPRRNRWGGGGRCARWGEKIAELVKDPVVAPFISAMDEAMNQFRDPSSTSSASASANNNAASQTNPVDPQKLTTDSNSQIEQEMIEKAILESLVINESKPVAPVTEEKKPVAEKKPTAAVHLETVRSANPTLPKPALRFVRDATIPDGTVLQPGAIFRKAWRVRNDGAHSWPEGAVLVSVGGDVMSDQEHKEPLPILSPEQDGEIAIQLTAPEKAGMYTAYYRAQTKEQQYFGQRLWASIVVAEHENDWTVVSENNNKTPTPAVSPLPSPSALPEPPILPVAPSAPVITPTVPPTAPVASEERKEDDAQVLPPPPSASTEGNNQPAHLRSAILLWRRELAILSEMGFSDSETIIPLLQQHLGTPLSLSADKNAAPKMEGMQQIVATLLQLT